MDRYSSTYYQSNTFTDANDNDEAVITDTVVDEIPATKKAKIAENNSQEDTTIDAVSNSNSAHATTLITTPTAPIETIDTVVPAKTREEILHDKLLNELSKPDSVFEPNSLSIFQGLIDLNASTCTIVRTVAKSYVGTTQVIPILVAWLEFARKLKDKSTSTNSSSDDSDESVRKICNDELSILIKQRFSKEKADAIWVEMDSHSSGDVDDFEWVETLLEEAIFRKLLIHLYNVNITSKFLYKVVTIISDKVCIYQCHFHVASFTFSCRVSMTN